MTVFIELAKKFSPGNVGTFFEGSGGHLALPPATLTSLTLACTQHFPLYSPLTKTSPLSPCHQVTQPSAPQRLLMPSSNFSPNRLSCQPTLYPTSHQLHPLHRCHAFFFLLYNMTQGLDCLLILTIIAYNTMTKHDVAALHDS
jgi:hypothetical protein